MRKFLLTSALALAFAGCAKTSGENARAGDTGAKDERGHPGAVAEVKQLGDSGVSGEIAFYPADGGVRVEGYMKGLAPNTTHGFHIHEHGDCSAPDGSSAGEHYNPTQHEHGAPGPSSHVGDMGNITSDGEGHATVSAFIADGNIGPAGPDKNGHGDIIGHAIIVHAKNDDLSTQPSGAAGPRIACGVIVAK